MKNLIIVAIITTVIIGGFYLIFGEGIQGDTPLEVLKILGSMWGYLFMTMWIIYRVVFRTVKVRSMTDDVIKGKRNW